MADEFGPAETTDESALQASANEADASDAQERDNRSWGLLSAIVVLVLVILVLIMFPRCTSRGGDTGRAAVGGREIVSVPNFEPLSGVVSLWVKPGSTADEILQAAGVTFDDTVDMGGGRVIVVVAKGAEADAVRRLKATEGVYDAGLVYGEKGAAVK
jgi:hypothetical protein